MTTLIACPKGCGGYVKAYSSGAPQYRQCYPCYKGISFQRNVDAEPADPALAPPCASENCQTLTNVQKIDPSKYYKYCQDCAHAKFKARPLSDAVASAVHEDYILPSL